MDIYELFSKFELELLPKEWVQNIWKEDFSNAVDFPPEYEDFLENETNIDELLVRASTFIKEWLDLGEFSNNSFSNRASSSLNRSLNTSHVDKSWQNLISNNVQHKALVSVLSIFILKGKTEKEFEVRNRGLMATDLYLRLLAIPGSQVYHIFNPILYSHAIENLKICTALNSTKPTENNKPARRKRKGKQDDDGLEDDEENESDPERNISHSEKTCVIKILCSVLDNLLFTLNGFQLKGQDDSLLITVQILILITRIKHGSSQIMSRTPPMNTTAYLASKAYKILLRLCSIDHGEVQETVRIILREIMPVFLVFDGKGPKTASMEEEKEVRDHSLQFVKNLLKVLKDDAFTGVCTLIQHICIKIPDKADFRTSGVHTVVELLRVLPYTLFSHLVVWIMSLAHNDQVKNRVTALEIITRLLEIERPVSSPLRQFPTKRRTLNHNAQENGNESGEDDDDGGIVLTQLPDFSTPKFLLGAIFSRCKDSVSTVRGKALSHLASLISSNNHRIRTEMELIFVKPYLDAEDIDSSNVYEKQFINYQHFLKNIKSETNSNVDPLPGAKAILNLLELYIGDLMVVVRRNAFQVLTKIFLLNEKLMSNKYLEMMVDSCRDHSVNVRKLLVPALSELLQRYPRHPHLPRYWIMGVMPLLADQEGASQEVVFKNLKETIIDNIVAYDKMRTDHHALPWVLLRLIGEYNNRQLFLFACYKWTLANNIKPELVPVIKSHIDTENNTAAWFLLASISEYLDIQNPSFVVDYFYNKVLERQQQVDEYCCQLVVEVTHLTWRQLCRDDQVMLCDKVLRWLQNFTIPLPMIARCVDICQLITEANADSPDVAKKRTYEWSTTLIKTCVSKLKRLVGPDSPLVVEDETRLGQYVFTLGEAAQICPGVIKDSTVDLIQNLLEFDRGEPNEQDGDQWKGTVRAATQAIAVVTLGKLCLQKDLLAQTVVPLFGYLLSETPHPEVKINIMIALTDMCIKFTSMVESYLVEMCYCLKDDNLEVRENTLALLIQLIQEDYLKLRCPMFFHLLTMLNDEYQSIRDKISSFIVNTVKPKHVHILQHHFVESLFHYNCYLGHKKYSKRGMMDIKERNLFSLEGSDAQNQNKRRRIYKFMLEHMLDDDRFRVLYRLCTVILSDVADGDIVLSTSGTELLKDALHLLACEEIKMSELRAKNRQQADEEETNEPKSNAELNAVCSLGRKILVSQVMRKSMVEYVVPIMIKLKNKLKQIKSPLVRDLMTCLQELMKDYKAEINEILADDKELAAEIMHDLQSLEQGEGEESGDDNQSEVNQSHDAVMKQAYMECMVKLHDVRKSLNVSRRSNSQRRSRSSRLSSCSAASHPSDNKSCSALSPSKASLAASRSPALSSLSPASHVAIASPGSSHSPRSANEVIQNWEIVNKTPLTGSCSPKSPLSEMKSGQNQSFSTRSRRSEPTTSSNVSEASCQSQNKKPSKKGKRKR